MSSIKPELKKTKQDMDLNPDRFYETSQNGGEE